MKNYQQEVLKRLKQEADPKKSEFLCGFMNTKYKCLGLSVPQMRKAVKQGYTFYELPEKKIQAIWSDIVKNATYFDEVSQALLYYQYRKNDLDKSHIKLFASWMPSIDNWEHSDRMSDLLAELHERFPSEVYPLYKKWNRHKNPWFRRQSIVGLFLYSNSRKKQPPFGKVLPLVHHLLKDSHLYVQKGYGWTLRELYNVYPKKTYAYLLTVAKEIPPAGWQAATEKLAKTQKARLMKIRKS